MKLTCPSKNLLREFLEGSISDADADQISDHVEDCSSCDLVLSTLESEQSDVLEDLREGIRTESLLQEPEFEQLRNTARFSQADAPTLPDVDEHPETGKRLRDYRLVKKIGEGGMGTVYQAFHVHLAKHVALKILPSDKLRSKQSVARFRQEMRAVGKVNHSNVVSASDAGTIDGQHFLVMELVQGADLGRIIHDRGPLCVADACEIVRQAAIGLQHAHDNGLVHRDVKPSNIMLALDGSVKLLDLGLAGLNNTELESTANVVVTDRLTSVGQIMGTLDYMAPEQITASPHVDGKADIYALGATLFQLLTGRTPCGDRSEAIPQRVEAVLHSPPLDIATLRNDVPGDLRALLLKMLSKNPEDRPESAIDVAGELKHLASDSDIVALAEECRTSLDMPSADVAVTDEISFLVSRSVEPDERIAKRKPLTAIGLWGTLLPLFAAAVWFIVTNNGIVKVEVLDETFKVAIDDQTLTISEDGNSQPITLRAGDHKLVVSIGNTKLMTNDFEISRNDKVVLRVERLKGEVIFSRNGEPIASGPIASEPVASEPVASGPIASGPIASGPIASKSVPETDNLSGVVYWEPDGPQRLVATALEKIESRKLIKSAWQSEKDGDVKAATDTYLKVLSLDPSYGSSSVVELFQEANRLVELGECIDETGLKRSIYEESLSRSTIKALLSDAKTRDLGLRVLRNYFRIYHRGRYSVLTSSEDFGIVWKDVPDLIYFLRVLLIPTDFEKEGAGWGRYSVLRIGDREEGSGPLSNASVLFCDKDVLRTFTNEVRGLTKENPGWKGGLVLLASLEAELGNFNQSVAIINEHFIGTTAPVIPMSTAWVLGLALEGKSHDLDQIVIRLYEYSMRKIMLNFDEFRGIDPLRFSPLNELARLYAKYGRKKEARQLLYGLVDASDQHPLVQGYTPSVFNNCNYGPSPSCVDCHRTEMNLPDYVMMSDVMTDIGYPVDSLISLARIDASFGNAFTSSDGWVEQKSLVRLTKEAKTPTVRYRRYSLPLQKRRAEQAVTPRSVIDALELGTFETKHRYSQRTYDRRRSRRDFRDPLDLIVWSRTLKLEETPSDAIDLMLSVRGEGPDAKATVFSPVIDVLKLAAEFEGPNAAKEIADLDARLRLLSEVDSNDVQAAVASTVFAFLREDLETAQKRLEVLKDLKLSSKNNAQRANATLWLAARYALQYEKTRAVGAVLAERAIAAAGALRGTRLQEAIVRERSGLGLSTILELRPEPREKLARKAEELGNSELAEWIRSDLPADEDKEGKEAFARAARLAEDEDWNAACDAFLEVFRANPNLFGAYVDGKFLTRTQIGCFEKAGRLTDLARFFNVTTLQRRRAFQSYGMNDLVIRLIEDRSPETRSAGYELLERVFQYRESVADSLLRGYSYKRFWKSVPDPVFLLRCWLIPKDIEKRGWAPFNPAAIHEDEGSFSNRLTRARPLLVDPKAMRQFADEVREQLEKQPKWIGGWALLALLEGEIGNYSEAAQLVSNHILKRDPATIPTLVLWSLGDFLLGKDEELDGIAVRLLELSVRKYSTSPRSGSLRISPITTLAKAYAEDNRDQEARQLLYGLVDPINQHPLVKGYAGNKLRCNLGTPSQCITCHRNDEGTIEETEFGGFYDVIKMSEAMTDIGYPIDTLMELARTDATFRNAFSSSRGWVDTSTEKGKYFEGRLSNRKFSIGFEYDEQTSKARSAVTPRKVIEALETDTFYRSSLRDEAIVSAALSLIRNAAGVDEKTKALRELARTSQERENKGSFALDLMLSVRGEGPHAQATVFSPIIDIFKLAAESKEPDAAKDIAELDKRLATLSEQHPKSIETRIAATVFAFLRKDLDSAKDRLKQLQSITNYPESDGAAFWLVARHALQHDQTRLLGAVISERALTAAEAQPDSRLKEAILRERTSIRSK